MRRDAFAEIQGENDNMNIKIVYEAPTAQDYVSLRLRSGMGNKDLNRSRIALKNSLFTVSIYDENVSNDVVGSENEDAVVELPDVEASVVGKLIGFGRVVGDGGITYVVSDIMVDKDYQRRGFAEQIMQAIDGYFEENAHEDSYICLIANHPADLLYSKHKFEYLPENRCGMLRNQSRK